MTIVVLLSVTSFPTTWRSSTLVLLFHTSVVTPLLTWWIFSWSSRASTVRLQLFSLHVTILLLLLISVVTVNRASTSTLPISLIFHFIWCFFYLRNYFDIRPWWLLASEVTLVVFSLPIFFEPVDQIHERRQILFVEVETFGSDFDELLYNLFFREISQDDVLLVLWKNDKSIRNSWSVSIFFTLKSFFDHFPTISVNPLWRPYNFSHQTIARNNVALDNFTKIFKRFAADRKSWTDWGTFWLVKLLNIDVNELLSPEFPSESNVIFTSSWRSEHKVSYLSFGKFCLSSLWRNVFELFMSNSSRDESTLIFVVRISIEVQIFQILCRYESFINAMLRSQDRFVLFVRSQVTLFAVKLNFEWISASFFLCLKIYAVNPSCDDKTRLNIGFELLFTINNHELAFGDDSSEPIFETTNDSAVSDDFAHCGCHDLAWFESSFCFINQQVEELLIAKKVVLIPRTSWVFEGRLKFIADVLDHYLHIALTCHFKLGVVSLDVEIVDKVRVCNHFLTMSILLGLINDIWVYILWI